VRVGPLRLSVRVDRVDLGELGEILIDYKTGHAKPGDWLTDRPDAPQVPLYAVLSQAEQIEAVAFALVHAGEEMKLEGYAVNSGVLTKMAKLKEAPTLEDQVERWRKVLTELAISFHDGDARVRPKKYPTTCSHCSQRVLCRLDVAALEEDDQNVTGEVEHG
jgi:ATP-dependent helicase/nuclease subunit B